MRDARRKTLEVRIVIKLGTPERGTEGEGCGAVGEGERSGIGEWGVGTVAETWGRGYRPVYISPQNASQSC